MIVLLEDNRDVAYVLKRLLCSLFGTCCRMYSDPDEALVEVFSGNADLVVSDIDIYGENEGLAFIRHLRSAMPCSCPPIIVYTGLSPDSGEYGEAVRLSDALYEKGETSLVELCRKIRRAMFSELVLFRDDCKIAVGTGTPAGLTASNLP